MKVELLLVSSLFGLAAVLPAASMAYRRQARLSKRPTGFQNTGPAFPQALLRRIGRRRRNAEVMAQWPTLLEGMAVAVIAGMDIRNAFEICSAKTYGVLRQACAKVMLRLHGGLPLPAALIAMEREEIEPATRLRTTLAQAEVLGTPIAEVLSTLSDEYYALEKQQFESRLNSLPVKLSVITVVFLLPPVLIVSIVPHVIAFMGSGW